MDYTVGPIQGHFSPGNHLMMIIDPDDSLIIGSLVYLKWGQVKDIIQYRSESLLEMFSDCITVSPPLDSG